MRKSAQPVFDLFVRDPKLEDFTVKELRSLAEQATSALVTHSLMKKFEKVSEADVESDDWETRLFGRLKAAEDASGDNMILHDLYMMLHLRD